MNRRSEHASREFAAAFTSWLPDKSWVEEWAVLPLFGSLLFTTIMQMAIFLLAYFLHNDKVFIAFS